MFCTFMTYSESCCHSNLRTYACMYVCTYVCVCVCVCVRVRMNVSICDMYVLCIYMCLRMYIYICIMYIRMHVRMYVFLITIRPVARWFARYFIRCINLKFYFLSEILGRRLFEGNGQIQRINGCILNEGGSVRVVRWDRIQAPRPKKSVNLQSRKARTVGMMYQVVPIDNAWPFASRSTQCRHSFIAAAPDTTSRT
jgi:hypothetical protein